MLFGGYDEAGYRSDTWLWTGGDWRPLRSGRSPSARETHGMVYHAGLGRIVLFGGEGGTGLVDDSWRRTTGP